VNFDPGQPSGNRRDPTGKKAQSGLPKAMCYTMRQKGMKSGIKEQNLEAGMGGWVPFHHSVNITL
jgi:hypothetical protein